MMKKKYLCAVLILIIRNLLDHILDEYMITGKKYFFNKESSDLKSLFLFGDLTRSLGICVLGVMLFFNRRIGLFKLRIIGSIGYVITILGCLVDSFYDIKYPLDVNYIYLFSCFFKSVSEYIFLILALDILRLNKWGYTIFQMATLSGNLLFNYLKLCNNALVNTVLSLVLIISINFLQKKGFEELEPVEKKNSILTYFLLVAVPLLQVLYPTIISFKPIENLILGNFQQSTPPGYLPYRSSFLPILMFVVPCLFVISSDVLNNISEPLYKCVSLIIFISCFTFSFISITHSSAAYFSLYYFFILRFIFKFISKLTRSPKGLGIFFSSYGIFNILLVVLKLDVYCIYQMILLLVPLLYLNIKEFFKNKFSREGEETELKLFIDHNETTKVNFSPSKEDLRDNLGPLVEKEKEPEIGLEDKESDNNIPENVNNLEITLENIKEEENLAKEKRELEIALKNLYDIIEDESHIKNEKESEIVLEVMKEPQDVLNTTIESSILIESKKEYDMETREQDPIPEYATILKNIESKSTSKSYGEDLKKNCKQKIRNKKVDEVHKEDQSALDRKQFKKSCVKEMKFSVENQKNKEFKSFANVNKNCSSTSTSHENTRDGLEFHSKKGHLEDKTSRIYKKEEMNKVENSGITSHGEMKYEEAFYDKRRKYESHDESTSTSESKLHKKSNFESKKDKSSCSKEIHNFCDTKRTTKKDELIETNKHKEDGTYIELVETFEKTESGCEDSKSKTCKNIKKVWIPSLSITETKHKDIFYEEREMNPALESFKKVDFYVEK